MNLISEIRRAMTIPRNFRRRILAESAYALPSTGDMAVMDLYAMYSLWWEEGGGQTAYGYNPTTFSNGKREDRVARLFEECLAKVAEVLLEEGRAALHDEAEQCFDPHLINAEVIIKWAKQREFLPRLAAFLRGDRFGYSDYVTLFSAPFWKEETDWYGGPPWAAISEAIMNLDAQFRRGEPKSLMLAVDKVFDIEHNTGTLASKFKRLVIKKQTLDLRAGFTRSQDFLPHVSGTVRDLIRKNPRPQ